MASFGTCTDCKGRLQTRRPQLNDTRNSMLKVSPLQSQITSITDEIGKTSEAKTDMARLQEVRRRREAAAKQREAEAAGKSLVSSDDLS